MRSSDPQEKGDGFRLFYSEFGETTGFPRGKAPLDLVALRTLYNNTVRGSINDCELWINQMDGLELLGDIPLITEYEDLQGNKYKTIPAWGDEKLRTLKAVIKILPSWKNMIQGEFSSWDKEAQDFIKFIEQETLFKVGGVGNGPDNGALIYID
jgi:adenylosuccinate synthase